MSKLGGPLRAVCDAQEAASPATEEFIKRVGVETAGTDGRNNGSSRNSICKNDEKQAPARLRYDPKLFFMVG